MIEDKSVLAIIPARAGSKGIKNKNINKFCGLPLIAHSINQAKDSKYVDKVIVSTESNIIKNIALDFGAEVPFMRPLTLANDTAGNNNVILHVLDNLKFDIFILLQPTSPLRKTYDIDTSLKEMVDNKASIMFSIYKVKNYIYGFNINNSRRVIMNKRITNISTNRQDHNNYYTVNGAIYAAYSHYFKKVKSFITPKTYTYLMPLDRSIDIDEMADWDFAEKLYNKN